MSRPPLPIPLNALPNDCRAAAAQLNRDCYCQTVDPLALKRALAGVANNSLDVLEERPNLFSHTRVYVADAHLDFMARLIAVIERLVELPAWRERVLSYAPEIATYRPKAAGVFLGYDFHLGSDGPQLIEINTNAGGGLLNAKLLGAQLSCCPQLEEVRLSQPQLEADFVAMFRNEWRLARGERPLQTIAIVDETPDTQFLAPEFELFRQLFEGKGIAARVLAPEALTYDGHQLRHGEEVIDLVYNRLTDFALAKESHAALRAAYLADAVVLTPHPHAHAIYADKRNLVALSDDAWLASIGVSPEERSVLQAGVPKTEEVLPDNAAGYWSNRKRWFFKPAAGFGSKAAYRGDKLTQRVFAEIAAGGYVAQALVRPSERRLQIDGVEKDLSLDLRNYVYQGRVQLVSARLYRGQTTNFRTPGGGFASVLSVGCQNEAEGCRQA